MIGVLGDSISSTFYINGTGQMLASGFYLPMLSAAVGQSLIPPTGAIPGTTLHDTVVHFDERYPSGCTTLVVNLGTNDAYHMAIDENGTSFANDWQLLFNMISAKTPKPSVTVIGLLPTLYGFGCPWAYDDAYLIGYLDNISREATYRNGGLWVPLPGIIKEMIRYDNHPNPIGHAYMTGEVLKRWGVA